MTSLTRFLLRKNLFIHYLTLSLLVLGTFAIFKIRREARPNVNFDRIALSAFYNGASASDIEELVIKPIEDELDGIDGIKEYRATAFEGVASMSIQLDPDYSDKDGVIDEVQRAVNQAQLPLDMEDPKVVEIKADKIQVYSFSIKSKLSEEEIRKEAKRLVDDLKELEGVASVDAEGLKELEFRVSIKPETLKKNLITLSEIMSSLANWNQVSPAGEVDEAGKTFSIRMDEKLNTQEQIENHVIKSQDGNYTLRVKDIAEVRLKTKKLKQEFLVNGEVAIGLAVKKVETADIIDVADRIEKFLKEYPFREGVGYVTYYNDSEAIKSSLKSIVINAAIGMLLVLFSLTFFVSTRLALVTSLGIPVALLGGVFVLYAMGMTLNTLVVLGMIVVLGMLIDDAIVVAENIYAHTEEGMLPLDAAVKGVSEVASPVVATVLTTVFAFLPIAFMDGIMGQFLRVIPITVITILVFSLFEAFVILPTHCADILKTQKAKTAGSKDIMSFLKEKYVRYIDWAISSKVSISFILTFIFTLTIGTYLAAKKIDFELFPRKGIGFLSITSEFPLNTHKDKTKEFISEFISELKSDSQIDKDVFSFSSNIGMSYKGGLSGVREQGGHLSMTTLRFTDDPSFIDREDGVIKAIKAKAKELSEKYGNKVNVSVPRPGPPVDADIQVMLSSRDFQQSKAAAAKIMELLSKREAVYNLESDLTNKSKYYRIIIDKELAIENGFNFSQISRVVFSAMYGIPATRTRVGEDEVDIVVSLENQNKRDLKDLKELYFLNRYGALVPLKSFARLKMDEATSSIQRVDGKRVVTVFGEVKKGESSPRKENIFLKSKLEELKKKYSTVKFDVGGSDLQRIDTLKETGLFYIFAILSIFLVISLSFNSIFFPFLVLTAIPFGLIGVVWALFLHSTPLSLMGLVGIVGLSGVVVNSSIILIQFLLQELRAGVPLRQAIQKAGERRFRPILITSVTTFLGLAPTIYSAAGKDAFIQPLVLSLGWGLVVSTLLTLFVLPTLVYLFLSPFYKK